MKVRILLTALAVTVFFPGQDLRAQDSATPKATPKESTATLEKTLSWLERHFETNFTYGYSTLESAADTATASHFESSITRAPLKFEDCTVLWRDRDEIVAVPLSEIDPSSVVVLLHTEANTKFDPELWQLALLTRNRKKSVIVQPPSGANQARNNVILLYDDKEIAQRFARAFQHAIKLCVEQVAPAVIVR